LELRTALFKALNCCDYGLQFIDAMGEGWKPTKVQIEIILNALEAVQKEYGHLCADMWDGEEEV
jgi:hypothetical protein